MKQPEIETIIYQVFDNLMEQSTELELEKQQSTPLVGDGSALDSLGLVNFLVALEQKLQDIVGSSFQIADQDLLIGEEQPLRSVETLSAYLAKKLS